MMVTGKIAYKTFLNFSVSAFNPFYALSSRLGKIIIRLPGRPIPGRSGFLSDDARIDSLSR